MGSNQCPGPARSRPLTGGQRREARFRSRAVAHPLGWGPLPVLVVVAAALVAGGHEQDGRRRWRRSSSTSITQKNRVLREFSAMAPDGTAPLADGCRCMPSAAAQPLASAQLAPDDRFTSSGTRRSNAPDMASRVTSTAASCSAGRHLEDHLVVHLQDEAAGEVARLEGVVEAHQRHLEDVGGQALDAGVHGLALPGLADAEVRRAELGDLAAAAEQRLGVAPLAGLGHRLVHVGPHRREGLEVGVEDGLRLRRSGWRGAGPGRRPPCRRPGRRRPSWPWTAARSVTSSGLTPKTRAAVSVWMSVPDSKAAIRPGSSARWAMQRSSIWL